MCIEVDKFNLKKMKNQPIKNTILKMKQLILTNVTFKAILSSYKEWLLLLGYASTTVYQLPIHLKEFLFYLETQGISKVTQVNQTVIDDYYNSLKQRSNHKRGGGLSNGYLNKHQQALERFKAFVNDHSNEPLYFSLDKEFITPRSSEAILTRLEVKQLFEATDYSHSWAKIRSRDKVMLVLLYSLGLRRNEAYHVCCQDIDYYKGTLHVRRGKNYTERLVPVNAKNLEFLKAYEDTYRLELLKDTPSDHLLLNYKGTPLTGQSFSNRLTVLQKLAKIDKSLTPHLLRHSIATHLLQSGATIEQISSFLGHRSLESTQLYTHLVGSIAPSY